MRSFLSLCLSLLAVISAFSRNSVSELPDSVFSGFQGKHHVQGIAVDTERNRVFFSFTTRLVVTDFSGNLIGSVDGLTGHLGCLAFDADSNRLYGSIEYKNDEIGRGIAGEAARNWKSRFFIAVFNPDEIVTAGMPAQEVMHTLELPEVAEDYHAVVRNNGRETDHRYGCSGIDGIALAPLPGKGKRRKMLYVAYGIYGDTTRTDNDYQVLNCYDIGHGRLRLLHRYFVFTGNTTFGIQNLCYNPVDNCLLAAVYRGSKKNFPNYSLFSISLSQRPHKETLRGFDSGEKQLVLPLADKGLSDTATGIRGWNFNYGSTGICWAEGDLFYISHNSSRPQQSSTIHLYRWTGDPSSPFILLNPRP